MNYIKQLPDLLKDIRFWIVFFFLLRMYSITLPPLEVGHNWRQTDGMMIARNFYERDANILYPRVDVAGEKSGIVGCEFPILNYGVYLAAVVFGYDHWYGRIIVLIFSSIGVYFFHWIIRKYFGEEAAFNASIILLVSLWFSYSRKNIPDAFAASLCIISLYYALQYFDHGRIVHLLLFFILALAGCLSKILAATLLTVLVIPLLDKKILLSRKALLSCFSLLILLSVCYWYFIWVPHLNKTYGYESHFFMGMSFKEGLHAILNNLNGVLKRFYDTALKYTGFITFVVSLVIVIRKKYWLALAVFLLPFLSFVILLIKTGASILGDQYYILTAIPPMAFIAGLGLAQISNRKIVAFILVIIAVEGVANQESDFRLRQPYKSLAQLEGIMDSVSGRNDLIVVNGETENPTVMYFAHRRGWSTPTRNLQDSNYVQDLRNRGCKYIVLAKKLYGDPDLAHKIVHDSEYFRIYQLEQLP
jgi:hypothetical protein